MPTVTVAGALWTQKTPTPTWTQKTPFIVGGGSRDLPGKLTLGPRDGLTAWNRW